MVILSFITLKIDQGVVLVVQILHHDQFLMLSIIILPFQDLLCLPLGCPTSTNIVVFIVYTHLCALPKHTAMGDFDYWYIHHDTPTTQVMRPALQCHYLGLFSPQDLHAVLCNCCSNTSVKDIAWKHWTKIFAEHWTGWEDSLSKYYNIYLLSKSIDRAGYCCILQQKTWSLHAQMLQNVNSNDTVNTELLSNDVMLVLLGLDHRHVFIIF